MFSASSLIISAFILDILAGSTVSMSVSYSPSNDSIIVLPWNITYLSQRDVTIRLPINYVIEPGISLTAACFAHKYYEDNAAAQCLSNLLSVGFRRFDIDLYWDSQRLLWSLCPVQVPPANLTKTASSTIMSSSSMGIASSTSTSSFNPSATSTMGTGTSLASVMVQRRASRTALVGRKALAAGQTPTSTQSSMTTITLAPTVVGNSTIIVVPTVAPGNTDEILYSIGSYTCTSSIDIDTIITVIQEYVAKSDTTLEAYLKYLIFNLHATASAFQPSEPAPAPLPSSLPDGDNLIGTLFGNTLQSSLYTPQLLEEQRTNLNSSWLNILTTLRPLTYYFTLDSNAAKVVSSPNGWPNGAFLELGNLRRLLLAFGTVDPQMAGYNFSADSDMLFAQGYTQELLNVTMSADGAVTRGCLFDSGATSLSAANSSWAVSSDILITDQTSTSYNTTLPSISNLTYCGIAPLLNQTLANTTADKDIRPYLQFAYSTIWSWAYGEPATDNDDDDVRCALFDPALEGRWRAVPCDQHHHAACQSQSSPYVWTISSSNGQYGSPTELDCPRNYSFAVPRTPLENRYLLEAFNRSGYSNSNALWINLNSLDVESCWVVGVNTTCPYVRGSSMQLVTVPTIAAVVVLIIAGLLILVKCNNNRSKSKRSRRGEGGWDYEGVPS